MRDIGDSLAADTSEVKNQARERTAVEDGMRAGAVVEVGVHRVTAYSVLEELVRQLPQATVAMGGHDMTPQGACVALVALDECSALAWSVPKGYGRREYSWSAASSWRDGLHPPVGFRTPVELESSSSPSHARSKPVRVTGGSELSA